jgi:hypothetical protein
MSSGNHALLVKPGKPVRALRLKRGWTQSEMAAYLGMNRGHLSDIERGKHARQRHHGSRLRLPMHATPGRPQSGQVSSSG